MGLETPNSQPAVPALSLPEWKQEEQEKVISHLGDSADLARGLLKAPPQTPGENAAEETRRMYEILVVRGTVAVEKLKLLKLMADGGKVTETARLAAEAALNDYNKTNTEYAALLSVERIADTMTGLGNLSKEERKLIMQIYLQPKRAARKGVTANPEGEKQYATIETLRMGIRASLERLNTLMGTDAAFVKKNNLWKVEMGTKLTDYRNALLKLEVTEDEARRKGLAPLKEKMFPDTKVKAEEFGELLKETKTQIPVPSLPQDKDKADWLRREYASLQMSQINLLKNLEQKQLELGQNFPDPGEEQWKELRQQLYSYLVLRERYLINAGFKKEEAMSTWLVMARTVVDIKALGLMDDAADWALKRIPVVSYLKELDKAQVGKLLKEGKILERDLVLRGVKQAPSTWEALAELDKTPGGKALVRESYLKSAFPPSILLLYAFHLRSGDNKVRASIDFCMSLGAFMGTEKAIGMLGKIAVAESGVSSAKMASLMKIPGNPMVKMVAAMAIMMAFHEQIESVNQWLQDKIPDNEFVRRVGFAVGFFGEHAIDVVSDKLRELNITSVDPAREELKFLSEERWPDVTTFKVDYVRSIADWNVMADQAISKQKNPMLRKLWEVEKITDVQAWSKRKSVEIYTGATTLFDMEKNLNEKLKSKGHSVDLFQIAFAGDGAPRNDHRVADSLSGYGESSALNKTNEFMKTLSSEDSLKKEWDEYVAHGKHLAQLVSVYRHLNVYDRSQWVGDTAKWTAEKKDITAYVQDGMKEDLAYRIRRSEALLVDTKAPVQERVQQTAQLTTSIKVWNAMSLMNWLGDLQSRYRKGIDLRPSQITGAPEYEPEVRELEALLNLTQHVARVVPPEELNQYLSQTRALALSKKDKVTIKELQIVRTELQSALLARNKSPYYEPVRVTSIKSELKLPAETPVLARGRLPEMEDTSYATGHGVRISPLKNAFGRAEFDVTYHLFEDLVILQGEGDKFWIKTELQCRGSDRGKWTVKVNSVQFQKFRERNRESITHNPTQELSFGDWYKSLSPKDRIDLESAFRKIEYRERDREAAMQRQELRNKELTERYRERLREQRENNIKRSEYSTEFFVETSLSDNEETREFHRRLKGDTMAKNKYQRNDIYIERPQRGPSIQSMDYVPPKSPEFNENWRYPSETDAVEFSLLESGKEVKKLRAGSFGDVTKFSEPDREAFLDLLCTPVETSTRIPLDRMLRLFPHKFYDAGFWTMGMREQYICRDKLLNTLFPIYAMAEGADNKRNFLRSLWEQLKAKGGIDRESTESIIQWFDANKQRFNPKGPEVETKFGFRNGKVDGRGVMEVSNNMKEGVPALWEILRERDALSMAVPQPSPSPSADAGMQQERAPLADLGQKLAETQVKLKQEVEKLTTSPDPFPYNLRKAIDAHRVELGSYHQKLDAYEKKIGALEARRKQEDAERQRRLRIEKTRQVRESAGMSHMTHINANNNTTYYTKQYGWWGNKYLYMKFDPGQSKWMVNLGSTDSWIEPASYTVDMWGGTGSYTTLIGKLAEINRME